MAKSYGMTIYNMTGIEGVISSLQSNGEVFTFKPDHVNEEPAAGWATSTTDNISGSFILTINDATFAFSFSFTSGHKPQFSVSPECSGIICVKRDEPSAHNNIAHATAYIYDPQGKK
ncbi:PREDICTED: uncharacterized protein LOC109580290 [Amphimedon queenslandica]|uniref:Uncharacterized protein n=1 Tax=Amphimedon queenslandica TaxID=400682 RepID=A0A1X7VHZ8_AMPQE|nr:PREDICTED: uncharacterized protein LOC109580290 [Amphimedon queenslandica]|eukprot:XP_019848876.1 PREDICTED: uncharacterized protein LOC109580290 [Amphimedon queenslandica]